MFFSTSTAALPEDVDATCLLGDDRCSSKLQILLLQIITVIRTKSGYRETRPSSDVIADPYVKTRCLNGHTLFAKGVML